MNSAPSVRKHQLQDLEAACHKFCWVQEHYVVSDKRSFRYIMASKLNRMTFSPCACIIYKIS